VIDEVKKSGLRGRGGAGFPTGLKWSFVPATARQAEVPGLQRRRVRARDLQGPAADGARPAPAPRGMRHLLLGGRRQHHCYIYIRGEYTDAARILEEAIATPTSRGSSAERARLGIPARRPRPPRRRRVHLRRGDRPARVARGQARPAARQAAVPGGGRRLRLPDGDQQRRDALLRAAHPRSAAPTGSRASAPTSATPAPSSTRSPATSSARAPTSTRSASPSASFSTPAAGCTGAARSRPSSRAAPRRRCSPPRTSTWRSTSTRSPRRARCSARRR
jgi:hypothetical protein